MIAGTLGPVGSMTTPKLHADDVALHALRLLQDNSLPPDAVVQIVDRLLSISSSGREVILPKELMDAFSEQSSAAATALTQTLATSPGMMLQDLQKLTSLGLTTLGDRGTVGLLKSFDLLHSVDDEDDGSSLGLQDTSVMLRRSSSSFVAPLADNSTSSISETIPHRLASEIGTHVRCYLQYHLVVSTPTATTVSHATLAESGRDFFSGIVPEELQKANQRHDRRSSSKLLKAACLRFPRERDAEFLALSYVVAEVQQTVRQALGKRNVSSHKETIIATQMPISTTAGACSMAPCTCMSHKFRA